MNLLKIKAKGVDNVAQKLLVYGAPKSGKTQAVGRLAGNPKFKKVIWFDLEQGFTTLLKLPDEILEKIELIQIKDTSENPIAITTIMKVFEKATTLCEAHGKVKERCLVCRKNSDAEYIDLDLHSEGPETLVVLDSFSQLSASALHHASGNGKTTVDLADLDVEGKATLNHYGMQGRYLDKILTDLQQLTCHVVVISHEINLIMDDSKEKLTASGGTTNFARKLPKAFDHVVRLLVQNKKHVGISNSTVNANVNAGSRLDAEILNEQKEVDLFRCFQTNDLANQKTSAKGNKSTPSPTGLKKNISIKKKN